MVNIVMNFKRTLFSLLANIKSTFNLLGIDAVIISITVVYEVKFML